MIVEFIGAPGAGKTSLMPEVIDLLQEKGIKAFTVVEAARPFASRTALGKLITCLTPPAWRRPLLWQLFYRLSVLYRLKFFLKHPRLIWLVVSSQRRRPKSADVRQRKVLFWFFRIVGYYEFLKSRANSDEALIFDEGFVHRVVQLNASGVEAPDPTRILAYVDLLPRPDIVIFVQAPAPVCRQRIYRRGLWPRFQHKERAEISQFVTHACSIVNVTAAHLAAKQWDVIAVDNSADDLAASKAALRAGMLSHLPVLSQEALYFQSV